MRVARIKGSGRSCYHCISRVVHRRFLMDKMAKAQFVKLMRRVEGFCDVRVLTYVVMDNHFHILLEVPAREEMIEDQELYRRMSCLYGRYRINEVAAGVEKWRREGRDDLADELKQNYLYRMHDVSEFMKTLKQRFTQWYNRREGLSGTLWESRFKSLLVEDSENALPKVSAYIDLNPVRAGMVRDPKDYRFCGYGEALATGGRALQGIERVVACFSNAGDGADAAALYRQHIYVSDGEKSILIEDVEQVLESGGVLPLPQLLACRIRYFTDGLVLGSRGFVEDVYLANRSRFGPRRKGGAHRLRYGEWDGLCSLRDLRRIPISIST